MSLFQDWIDAKEAERAAVARRREIEDLLTAEWAVPENFEAARSWTDGEYKITLTGRMSRKVDAKAVEEIAAEHGLTSQLDQLFRWSADINKKAWASAARELTEVFAPAITTKPSRLSYKIEKIEEN